MKKAWRGLNINSSGVVSLSAPLKNWNLLIIILSDFILPTFLHTPQPHIISVLSYLQENQTMTYCSISPLLEEKEAICVIHKRSAAVSKSPSF